MTSLSRTPMAWAMPSKPCSASSSRISSRAVGWSWWVIVGLAPCTGLATFQGTGDDLPLQAESPPRRAGNLQKPGCTTQALAADPIEQLRRDQPLGQRPPLRLGHARPVEALLVAQPALGQVQPHVERAMPLRADVVDTDGALAIGL